ncbi:hypothetical protein H4R18_000288 [Coemansia javaensis]|uniref:Uncharacterized protein n=1 Tax=Coemansia javaensis TaxID=2761396 RepID=A0A9W8HIY1_9FUNG|nr:hypothetical protein H4R18_000288 [Coemansia javaensis]
MSARSRLLAVVAAQKRREADAARAESDLLYLRDIHLAAAIQQLAHQQHQQHRAALHALLQTSAHVSDDGSICILLHDHCLGSGWLGKAALASTAAQQQLEATAVPEPCGAGSVFRFRVPTLCDEWRIQLSLVFDPQYDVPGFVRTPVAVHVDSHHIDALDAAVPCTDLPPHRHCRGQDAELDLPCLCEIWLSMAGQKEPGQPKPDLHPLARPLLLALLFDALPPQPHRRVAAILAGSYSAEFCMPGAADQRDAVTLMCVPEHGRLALRIRSHNPVAFSAAVAAVAARLLLLLLGRDAGPCAQALGDLQAKHARLAAALARGSEEAPAAHADFVLVEDVEPTAILALGERE